MTMYICSQVISYTTLYWISFPIHLISWTSVKNSYKIHQNQITDHKDMFWSLWTCHFYSNEKTSNTNDLDSNYFYFNSLYPQKNDNVTSIHFWVLTREWWQNLFLLLKRQPHCKYGCNSLVTVNFATMPHNFLYKNKINTVNLVVATSAMWLKLQICGQNVVCFKCHREVCILHEAVDF